jgi:hypothetical protein
VSTPRSSGERVPAARAAETLHSSVPGAHAVGFSSPSCAPPVPALAATLRARSLGLGARAGRTARRPRSPTAGEERMVRPHRCVAGK